MHQAPVTLLKERTFTGKFFVAFVHAAPCSPLTLSLFTLYACHAWHAALVVDYMSIILSPFDVVLMGSSQCPA